MTDPAALLAACEAGLDWMLASLDELVRLESPSDDKAAVDAVVDVLAAHGAALGARVTRFPAASAGDHLRLGFGPASGGPRVLLLGHTDTVWPRGTLAAMPLARRDGRLHGPGVYDMKGGLVVALQALRAIGPALAGPVTLLMTSDEEVGSSTSRALIEAEARDVAAVLVLEPALETPDAPHGGVKTGRKGVGEFRLEVAGVAAHAGSEPEKGASAVRELARQLIAIDGLARPDRGTTINAGVIGGGTRGNVVAEQAWAAIDVRVLELAEARRIETAFADLRAADPRVRVRVTGGVNRPPLEPSAAGRRLYEQATEVALALGLALPSGTVGGASDGNFTAALGIPTLDGLGPSGGGAHARDEHVRIASLPVRAALLAGLLGRLAGS